MEKKGTRPQRIAPEQVDGAVNEALMRVAQAVELSKEEVNKVSGGMSAVFSPVGLPGDPDGFGGITIGLMAEPDPIQG